MKRFLLVFMFMSASVVAVDCSHKRIARLVLPYEKAIDIIDGFDPDREINDHDIYLFFSKSDLYQRNNIRKFESVVRTIKRLTYSKKSLSNNRNELECLIDKLDKVQNFIVDYATTYYALITYYEIAACYYYIDEQHEAVVNLITQQSEKLGLPSMQGRGLYKFVKKIDLDIRRLTALFVQNMISDELMVKINQAKTKLVILKRKIIMSLEYKHQLSKTRSLKAFGVLIPLIGVVLGGMIVLTLMLIVANSSLYPVSFGLLPFFAVGFGITMQEMSESTKYNIPVHSTSIFSWFRPFLPLTWIPRG